MSSAGRPMNPPLSGCQTFVDEGFAPGNLRNPGGDPAQICYESTKNARYRELALEWARASQTTQPWQAWPYAVYAKLSQDGQDRRRAIAMAYYLDRNSVRLNTIPKREIERAVKEFGRRNPFLNMRLKAEENPA